MPRKRKTGVSETVSEEAFLRSINIVYDADEPERIAHFRPTAKTEPLLKALFGKRMSVPISSWPLMEAANR